jgi:hypothetical protein
MRTIMENWNQFLTKDKLKIVIRENQMNPKLDYESSEQVTKLAADPEIAAIMTGQPGGRLAKKISSLARKLSGAETESGAIEMNPERQAKELMFNQEFQQQLVNAASKNPQKQKDALEFMIGLDQKRHLSGYARKDRKLAQDTLPTDDEIKKNPDSLTALITMSSQERDAARDKIKSEKEAERTDFLSAKKSSPTTTAPQRIVPVELQGAYNFLSTNKETNQQLFKQLIKDKNWPELMKLAQKMGYKK